MPDNIFLRIFFSFRKLFLFTGEKLESTATNDSNHSKYDVFFIFTTHKVKKNKKQHTSRVETLSFLRYRDVTQAYLT